MPVEIGCPACQSKLRVPEELIGRKVRCPQCRQAFQAAGPAGTETAAATTEEPVLAEVVTGPEAAATRPARRPREAPPHNVEAAPKERGDNRPAAVQGARPGYLTRTPGWQAVYQGLGSISGGMMTVLAAAVLAIAGYFALNALAAGPLDKVPVGAMQGLAGGSLALVGLAILAIQVGIVLCCAAPDDAHSKRPAVAALVCLINAPILAYLSTLIRMPDLVREADWNRLPPHTHITIPSFIAAVVAVLGLACFLLSMRRIGRYFQDRRLTAGSTIYLGLVVLLLVGGIGAFVYDAAVGIDFGGKKDLMLPDPEKGHAKEGDPLLDFVGGTEGLIAAGIAVVGGLILFFWFLEILRRARLVIARAQREGAA